MKPHEETWIAADGGIGFEEEHIATFWGACPVAAPRAVLAAAAPEMARALLGLGYVRRGGDESWHSDICNELNDGSMDCEESCKAAKAALKKAGVL